MSLKVPPFTLIGLFLLAVTISGMSCTVIVTI